MGGKQEQIEQWVKENKVFVASKSYCPFCQQTKALLKSLGVDAYTIELDQRGEYFKRLITSNGTNVYR
jgi:glutaredoxin